MRRIMSQDVFKAPRAKRNHKSELKGWSPAKRQRTKEDFFSFCNIVLQYTQYETMKQEEMRARNNTSPLDSGGSTAESYSEESTSSYIEAENDENRSSTNDRHVPRSSQMDSGDEDSYELITCFCMKPFAGRPMIECSECLTWIHLSCAKIRKSNIPDDFVCQSCRESKFTTRKSSRIRSEKKMVNA